jgi:hypothetical protein
MISNIFWFFGFFQFINLLIYLIRFKRVNYALEWNYKFIEIVGKHPKREDFRKLDFKILWNRTILNSLEIIWIFLGLLTINWYIFLLILIVYVIIIFGLDKWRFSVIDNVIRFFFTAIRCFTWISLSIINIHY